MTEANKIKETGGRGRISVVTLSYNQGPFLKECIDSVLSQGRELVEYIVVDPGSSDQSHRIIAGYGSEIDHVLLESDEGPADGLNKGFALARGDIFAYVNADDRLCKGAAEFALRYFAAHPDVDVLCGAIRLIDKSGRVSLRCRTADRFDIRKYAVGICTVGQQATFFRRRAFERAGGFNVENRVAWDGELLVDMALSGARFETVYKVLGDFRVYGGTITGSGDYRRRYAEYQSRLNRKLRERQIDPYPPFMAAGLRLAYKCNPARHLGYLLARFA